MAKTLFKFHHRTDGTTEVSCMETDDTFTYTTVSGPQSADDFMLKVVKDNLISYTTDKAPEPEETEEVQEEDETGTVRTVKKPKGKGKR